MYENLRVCHCQMAGKKSQLLADAITHIFLQETVLTKKIPVPTIL